MSEKYIIWRISFLAVAICLLAIGQNPVVGAEKVNSLEKEKELIGILQSDAPAQEKAITCKYLAIYGSAKAVPELAKLLADERFSSWARIALEAIPGPASEKALRDAAGGLEGRLLIGVINSIGVRRDAQAVGLLVAKMSDANGDVASSAAVALGNIGNDQAAQALAKALADAGDDVRDAIAMGCILCAERRLDENNHAAAMKLYDLVRKSEVSDQRQLEAIRGAILARGSSGAPLLIEQLRSKDKLRFGIGLRAARELPGLDVTKALAVEMERMSQDRQPLLLLALADRNDSAVLPIVLNAAKSSPKKLRITAVGALVGLGDVSSIPVLLEAATEADEDLAYAAKRTLVLLHGEGVDVSLLDRLPQARGKKRQILIELTGLRHIKEGLPLAVESIKDTDAGVRVAAVEVIGIFGKVEQAEDLVGLLGKISNPGERKEIQKALLSLCGRWGVESLPYLLPLMKSDDSDLRIIGLHALAVAGGPGALAEVISAIDNPTVKVQDEAVRVLSTWPNKWPQDASAGEALLKLAKSSKKKPHQILGLRGYMQYVRENKQLSNDYKVAAVSDLLPLLQRPEEKWLAISVVGKSPMPAALEILTILAKEPKVAEEAYSAMVDLVSMKPNSISSEQRRETIQAVIKNSKNEATKRKARKSL